jgi:hypothetical protein
MPAIRTAIPRGPSGASFTGGQRVSSGYVATNQGQTHRTASGLATNTGQTHQTPSGFATNQGQTHQTLASMTGNQLSPQAMAMMAQGYTPSGPSHVWSGGVPVHRPMRIPGGHIGRFLTPSGPVAVFVGANGQPVVVSTQPSDGGGGGDGPSVAASPQTVDPQSLETPSGAPSSPTADQGTTVPGQPSSAPPTIIVQQAPASKWEEYAAMAAVVAAVAGGVWFLMTKMKKHGGMPEFGRDDDEDER